MPHIYTSRLPTFLEFHDYVLQHGSAEEQLVHLTPDPSSPEKIALYQKWIESQQISSHTFVDENGNSTVLFDNTDVG